MSLAHKLERERYDALRKRVGEAYRELAALLPLTCDDQNHLYCGRIRKTHALLKAAVEGER